MKTILRFISEVQDYKIVLYRESKNTSKIETYEPPDDTPVTWAMLRDAVHGLREAIVADLAEHMEDRHLTTAPELEKEM